MALADLMADHLVDLIGLQTDFGEQRIPRLQAEIDAEPHHGDRIGLHELREGVRQFCRQQSAHFLPDEIGNHIA